MKAVAFQYVCVWAKVLGHMLQDYARIPDDFHGYTALLQDLWSAFLQWLNDHDRLDMGLAQMVEEFQKYVRDHLSMVNEQNQRQLNPQHFEGDQALLTLIKNANAKGALLRSCAHQGAVNITLQRMTLGDFLKHMELTDDPGVPPLVVFVTSLTPMAFVGGMQFQNYFDQNHHHFKAKKPPFSSLVALGSVVATQLLWPGESGDFKKLLEACKMVEKGGEKRREGKIHALPIGDILRDILQVAAQGTRKRRRRAARSDVANRIASIIGDLLRTDWQEVVQHTSSPSDKEQADRQKMVLQGNVQHTRSSSGIEQADQSLPEIPVDSNVENVGEFDHARSELLLVLESCLNKLKEFEDCPQLNALVQCLSVQAQRNVMIRLPALAQDKGIVRKLEEIDNLIRERCKCGDSAWPEPASLKGRYLLDLLLEVEDLLERYVGVQRGRVDGKLKKAVDASKEALMNLGIRRPGRQEIADYIRQNPCMWIFVIEQFCKEDQR